ncbi:hypothetical protein VYU27_002562 [Nannochloropsis oceanica]
MKMLPLIGWVLTLSRQQTASAAAMSSLNAFVLAPRLAGCMRPVVAKSAASGARRTAATHVTVTSTDTNPPLTSSASPSITREVSTTTITARPTATPLLDMHDVTVQSNPSKGPMMQRLRVHVMPLESNKLEMLLAQVYARVLKGGGVLGMDAEWQPEIARFERNPVALLQLAWEEDVFLVRLQHLQGEVPASLHKLMSDVSIVKVGCNIGGDAKRLLQDYALDTRGHVDLKEVTSGLGLVRCKRRSMAWLAKEFLSIEMDKSQQCSDWGNVELSPEQIKYSSIDAWVAGAIAGNLFRTYKGQVGQPTCVSSFCKRLVPQHVNRRAHSGSDGRAKYDRKGGKKWRRLQKQEEPEPQQQQRVQQQQLQSMQQQQQQQLQSMQQQQQQQQVQQQQQPQAQVCNIM